MKRLRIDGPWRSVAGAGPVFLVAMVVAASGPVTGGCSSPDANATTTIDVPDLTAFIGDSTGSVSGFLEARCGTLDCHGQPGQPMRLYSGSGLRLPNDAGDYTGSGGTTHDERVENYLAVVGLQPEQMSAVVEDKATNVASLYLLTKPLNRVQHKGGAVLSSINDDGAVCLTSWLGGQVDLTSCQRASLIRATP